MSFADWSISGKTKETGLHKPSALFAMTPSLLSAFYIRTTFEKGILSTLRVAHREAKWVTSKGRAKCTALKPSHGHVSVMKRSITVTHSVLKRLKGNHGERLVKAQRNKSRYIKNSFVLTHKVQSNMIDGVSGCDGRIKKAFA